MAIIYRLGVMLNGGDFTEPLDKNEGDVNLPDSAFMEELTKNIGSLEELEELRKLGINVNDITLMEPETI